MSSIIQVSNLSKSYTITHEGKERYTALRDVMAQKGKKNIFIARRHDEATFARKYDERHCGEERRSKTLK